MWQPVNYTQITTYGVNFSAKLLLGNILNSDLIKILDVSYSFLHQNKESGKYISKYVFDYPVHSFGLNVYHTFFKNFELNWRAGYKFRTGTYSFLNKITGNIDELPYPAYWLIDVKLDYSLKSITFFVTINNLFDTKYYELSNVTPPGKWIKGGVKVSF